MPKIEKFTKHHIEGGAANAPADRTLKRAHEVFKDQRIVPESLFRMGNSLLTNEAQSLQFTSKRPYAECLFEVLRLKPYLRFGVAVYAPDRDFGNVQFVDEEPAHDD